MDYMEHVKLMKTLSSSYAQINMTTSPRDHGRPSHYVLRKEGKEFSVARMRFASPGNTELFSLRLILSKRPINSFRDGKRW